MYNIGIWNIEPHVRDVKYKIPGVSSHAPG